MAGRVDKVDQEAAELLLLIADLVVFDLGFIFDEFEILVLQLEEQGNSAEIWSVVLGKWTHVDLMVIPRSISSLRTSM